MTPRLFDAHRHAARSGEVLAILAAHGFASLVGGDEQDARRLSPARVAGEARLALEDLGPMWVKLGQFLSTRPDLLPPPFVSELARLQDSGRPISSEDVHHVIEEELGKAPLDLFATFDDAPIASASIGQAHAARLVDGSPVVVKVRRPGAVELIELDLEILRELALRAERHWQAASALDVVALVAEFSRSLRAELDYVEEARHAERFAENFADNEMIHVPTVHWRLTTSRVLTLERIEGIKIDDFSALDAAGIDRPALIALAIDAVAQMVFVDGLFHADPHPGNLFVLPGGAIGLIDFGMVGEVTPAQREHLADLFVAVLSTRASSVAVALLRLTTKSRISDLDVLTADVARLLATIEGPGLEDVPMAELLVRLVAMMRKHGLQLQPSLASLVRTLVMVEGLGVQLDPTFRLGEALRPRAKALTAARFDLDSLLARLRSAGIDTALLGLDAPGRLRSLLERMDVDGLQVHLRAAELEPLVERIERVGSRLVVGMIAAALIGGIGQLSSSGAAPGSSSGRRLLRAGYLLVGGFSGYLAWTARHRRP